MKKILFISLISIFFLISCYEIEEVTEFTVEGRILQYGSDKPIPNAKIYIIKCMPDTKVLGGSQNCVNHDTIFADSKGNYKVTVPSDEWVYSFYAIAPNHQKSQEQAVFNQKRNIHLRPYAWIGIRVVNEKPHDQFDEISLIYPWLEADFTYNAVYSGMNINKLIYRYHGFGNDTIRIYKKVYKGKPQQDYELLKFYSGAIDTTLVEIRY